MRHQIPAILAFGLIIALAILVAQVVTKQSRIVQDQYAQMESIDFPVKAKQSMTK